jgi:flagellar biosynthetic protein FliR
MEVYANQVIAVLLVSLRVAPTFAFAPPFTLLRTPASVRVALSLGLAIWLVVAHPATTSGVDVSSRGLIAAAASELLLGMTLTVALQIAFAALMTAGRAIDIQVGFGLAQIADPTLRTHMPLVGALFSYAAAAVFFATDGPLDLLAIWSRSIEAIPLGGFITGPRLEPLLGYMQVVFILAMGLAGIVFLVLFLIDLSVAFMSRTLPQMNVLLLGFQVKTIALLLTLPFVFAFSGAVFLRLMRLAVDAMPELI